MEISKIAMYKFWNDYVKPKHREKMELCYMNRFIVYIKTENIHVDIAKDVETKVDTLNYELERSLHEKNIKKVLGLMKD